MFLSDKKYLVVQPLGGLGNRLMSLLSAHDLAIRDGRELWVHWTTPRGAPSARLQIALAEIYSIEGITLIGRKGVSNAMQHSDRKIFRLSRAHRELTLGCDEQVLFAPMHGRLMTEGDRFDAWHDLFWRKYRLVDALDQQVSQFKQTYFDRPVVGFQIRVHGHRLARNWKPTDRFVKLAKQIVDDNADTRIFISADDVRVTAGFKQLFGSRIIALEKTNQLNTGPALRHTIIDCHLLHACNQFYSSRFSGLSYYIAVLRNEPRVYPE